MNQGLAPLLFEKKSRIERTESAFRLCVTSLYECVSDGTIIIIPQSRGVKEETIYQHSTHFFIFYEIDHAWNK